MPKGTTEKRRLIKFSNYSMCVTLPKWVIDQLAWQKGDVLTLTTDVKHGKITLFREEKDQRSALKDSNTESEAPAAAAESPETEEQIIPVNELTEQVESTEATDEQLKPRW